MNLNTLISNELYNILQNYNKKEHEDNISNSLKNMKIKDLKESLTNEKEKSKQDYKNIKIINNLLNEYLKVLRSKCLIIFEFLSDAIDAVKDMDELISDVDKTEYKNLLFSNIDTDSLIFKRKNFKKELESFLNFFKEVTMLEYNLYEEIKLYVCRLVIFIYN